MVIWKWIGKQNIFIKIIWMLIYFCLYIFLIDIIVSVVFFFKNTSKEGELLAENYKIASQAEDFIRDYFDKKDNEFIESKFKISKNIQLNSCNFIIDVENKTFGFFTPSFYYVAYEDMIYELVYKKFDLKEQPQNIIDINSLKEEIYNILESNTYDFCECKVYNFSDLNRVEFIDKSRTDEKRTYTMESKSGDAFWGAVGGSLLSETIFNEYATAGAIIGASGERKVTENVERDTHIEFCVNVYLNDIENPYETFTFNNENKLREFIGALEYIKNNK